MKPSTLLFVIVGSVFFFAVESSSIAKPSSEDEPEEPTYDPRFVAVFIKTDDVVNATSSTTNTTSNSDYQNVFKKVRNSTVTKIEDLVNNLNVTGKVDSIISKLGGEGTEEAAKFKNILKTLENSTLSTNAISTVKNILTELESGNGFAVLV